MATRVRLPTQVFEHLQIVLPCKTKMALLSIWVQRADTFAKRAQALDFEWVDLGDVQFVRRQCEHASREFHEHCIQHGC